MRAMVSQLVQRGAWLTAGVVIGVSFVAQALKFRAQDVPLAHLVSAGSAIFHGAHLLQLLLFAALGGLALAQTAPARRALGLLAVAMASLLLQFALMPAFDARVAALAAGTPLPPAPWLHGAYAALELLKVAALVAVGRFERAPVNARDLRERRPRLAAWRSAR